MLSKASLAFAVVAAAAPVLASEPERDRVDAARPAGVSSPEGAIVRLDLGPNATAPWRPTFEWYANDVEKPGAPSTSAPEIIPFPQSWMTLVAETYEGAFPTGAWSVFDGDGATGGEYYWDDDDYRPCHGLWSAWPANGGADGVDPQYFYYPPDLHSWMVFGPFSLAEMDRASWQFRLWNRSEAGWDHFFHGVSTDGSTFYGTLESGDTEGWVTRYVDFAAHPYFGNLLGSPSVWVAFNFQSDESVQDDGPFVDDVSILQDPGPGTGIDGHTVRAQWRYPTFAEVIEQHDVVVGPAVELTDAIITSGSGLEIDLEGGVVRFDFLSGGYWGETDFNGWSITDHLDRIPPIADYQLKASIAAGVWNIGCDFDSQSVWCDLNGLEAQAGDWIELRLLFEVFSDGFETGLLGSWTGVANADS